MPSELSSLANTGLAGIALATLLLLGIFIRFFFKFMSNHMSENTKSNQELRESNIQLSGVIKELKDFLYHQNGRKPND